MINKGWKLVNHWISPQTSFRVQDEKGKESSKICMAPLKTKIRRRIIQIIDYNKGHKWRRQFEIIILCMVLKVWKQWLAWDEGLILNGASTWCSLKWSAAMLKFSVDSIACSFSGMLFTVLRSAVFIYVSQNTTMQTHFYTFKYTNTFVEVPSHFRTFYYQLKMQLINVMPHLNLTPKEK